ncbi:hypothetical protein QE152_g22475 [Popillia japonica]|uniref:Uncharacterized protein n=1 Tax=Popillia japonica TaxID=7064 RepID=A0AAW1KKW5_POPJA
MSANYSAVLKRNNSSEINAVKQVINKKTYAETAGEAMLIKPKNPQDSEKTKTDIKNQLSPANLEVGIKEIRTVKDGGILIKCANKTEVDKLKKEAQNKLQKKLCYKNIP